MTTKEQLFIKCKDFITKKESIIKKAILEIEIAFQSETKSSAGDKHETGRAMLHLEREKLGNQLAQTQKISSTLFKIKISKTYLTVVLGSLVYTTQANYFIAISAGKFIVNNQEFYAISPITPIAKLLLGKSCGHEVNFNNRLFKIKEIV